MLPALKLGKVDTETIRRQALDRLEQMNMKDQANQLASRLSGGQQQRVAIARALINNPDIIMADEPTGNLDSANSDMVLNIFRDLAKKGNTIVVVTHDTDFAAQSDRTIEMSDGRITCSRQRE